MHLLESEYICLYYLVCEVKGIDTSEFMDFCENLQDKDPRTMAHHFHGWVVPHIN